MLRNTYITSVKILFTFHIKNNTRKEFQNVQLTTDTQNYQNELPTTWFCFRCFAFALEPLVWE